MTNGGQRQAGAVCSKEIRTCNLINTMQVYQYGEEMGNFIRDCFKATSTYVRRPLTSHLILNLLTTTEEKPHSPGGHPEDPWKTT